MLPRLYRSDADNRQKQINTLKVFNDNVTEIVEGFEYRVSFISGKNDLCLHVSLPGDFPKEKPIITVTPKLAHPWVSADGEVTSAPGLLNFTVHSDLGRVVQAIIREFDRNPPPLAGEQSMAATSNMPAIGEIKDAVNASSYYYNSGGYAPGKSLPLNYKSTTNIAGGAAATFQSLAFPELNELPLEELQYLNESQDYRDEFVDNLPQVVELNKTLDETIMQVEELAQNTLKEKERLAAAKEKIYRGVEEVTKLAFENERLHAIYQALSDRYSPKNIREQLRLATAKADTESEEIAEHFLHGELSVDRFLSMYVKARTAYQTRKTKEEKLSQQLDSLERAGF